MKKQVLLIKRRDVPVWVIPGGRSEPGEQPLDTALREFGEETGVKLGSHAVQLVAIYSPVKKTGRTKYLYCLKVTRNLNLRTTNESSAFGFFDLHNLPYPISQYEKKKIHDAYLKSNNKPLKRPDSVDYWEEFFALLEKPFLLTNLICRYLISKLR
jgi:8-oxo-dGTP pyrophosphatase MutT (NUDIX family)